ncbi:ankyrin repeat-containing domain protein, partial [Baffinella frigidus]
MEIAINRAIISAVYSGNLHKIESLFRDGRDINELDSSGRTALHIATKLKNFEAVCTLCDCSSDASFLDHKNRQGMTALHIAVRMQDIRIATFLLARGA